MNQKLWKRKEKVKQAGSLLGKDFGYGVGKACVAHFIMPQNQSECKDLTLVCVMISI